MGRLRRRATIARNGITQILETAADYGFEGEEWASLARETRKVAKALRTVERPEEMALVVGSLERRQHAARDRLENLLFAATVSSSGAVDSAPKGPENRPHQITYNPNLDPEPDTVIAREECKPPPGAAVSPQAPAERPARPQETSSAKAARVDERVLRLTADELVRLAPRLRPYLASPAPSWPEVVDAADWLRSELGVSKPLWGEACLAMGREEAAIAVAIVSAKPKDHFRTTPGGYFFGMVAKAKAGELNLARTIWGLRGRERRGGEGRSPRPAN